MSASREEFSIEDAEDAFDAGDYELAIDLCEALIEQDPDDVEALYLLGESLVQIDDVEAAEQVYRDALEIEPDHPLLRAGLGVSLFEQGRFDEARAELEAARTGDAELPTAPWYLGLLAERRGDARAAATLFRKASELDAEQFPPPGAWTGSQVLDAVRQAASRVPEPVRAYLSDLPAEVEDLPGDALLREHTPPLSPLLLCLFEGEGDDTPHGPRPARVRLFRRNLEKVSRTEEELAEEVARALLYEMVHFLELEDDEAQRLGIEEALFGPPGSGPDIGAAIDSAEGFDEDEEPGDEEPEALDHGRSASPPAGSDATRGPRGGPGRRGNGRGR